MQLSRRGREVTAVVEWRNPPAVAALLAFAVLAVAASALVAPAAARDTQQSASTGAQSSVEADMVDCLRAVAAVGSSLNSAWPGFRTGAQVFVLTVDPSGPVVALGGSRPAPGFQASPRDRQISVRRGPVPDTMRGLRIAANWNDDPAVATSIPYSGRGCAHRMVHEAFHSFQLKQRRLGKFRRVMAGPPATGASTPAADALLLVEGRFLAEALLLRDSVARLGAMREAYLARALRCRAAGPDSCAQENDLVSVEGTAEYVATTVFAAGTVSQARQTARDTVEKYLNFVPASRSLGRPYLIWIGAAWTMLVADVGGAWHERVAANGLVPTVAAMTGPVAFERSVTFRALLDSAEATVSALARQARLAEESRLRAFSAQRGIVVRLTWVTVNGLSEVSRGSGQLTESVLTWPGGMNTITARGIVLRGCCPEFLSVVVPRDSLFFSVDGRALPIDMAGSARGRIEFRGAGLHAMLESGAVTVRHDSVTIQVERR